MPSKKQSIPTPAIIDWLRKQDRSGTVAYSPDPWASFTGGNGAGPARRFAAPHPGASRPVTDTARVRRVA